MRPLGEYFQKSASYRDLKELADWLRGEAGFEKIAFALPGHGFMEALAASPADAELLADDETERFVASMLREKTGGEFVAAPGLDRGAPAWVPEGREAVIVPAVFSTKIEGCPGVECCFSHWRRMSASTKLCSSRDFFTGEYCCASRSTREPGWDRTACAYCPLFPFAFVLVASRKRLGDADSRDLQMVKLKVMHVAEKSRWEMETRKAGELNSAVSKVMIKMNETLDLEKRMTLLLGASLAMLVADMGCVLLHDPDGGLVEMIASRSIPEGLWEAHASGIATGPLVAHAEAVIRGGRPVLVNDARRAEPPLGPDLRSAILIPLRSKERVIGVLFLGNGPGSRGFCRADLVLMESLSIMSTAGIENALLYERMEDKERLHRTLLAKIINAQEDERKRIASDIHDDTIQALISSFYRVEGAEMFLSSGSYAEIARELEQIKEDLQRNIRGMRRLLFELRPSILDDAGLVPAIENYINRMEEDSGISSAFYVEEGIDRLEPEVEITIYRLAQEVLTNVRKHANASEIALKMVRRGRNIELSIMDNGQGFDVARVMQDNGYEEHLGLKSIMERAELAGGEVIITSAPGEGAEVKIRIPGMI